MNDQDTIDRFEELEAGRILGDLDPEEIKEWEKLSADPLCQADLSLELTAAALDVEFAESENVDLPEKLFENLRDGMADFVSAESPEASVISPPKWQKLISAPNRSALCDTLCHPIDGRKDS